MTAGIGIAYWPRDLLPRAMVAQLLGEPCAARPQAVIGDPAVVVSDDANVDLVRWR